MRVAVMQPYFYPYMGYFRLIAAVDLFVLFDCVQAPQRGRVHRTALSGAPGEEEWLTLPLAKQPRETPIRELRLAEDRDARWHRALGRLEARVPRPRDPGLLAALRAPLPEGALPWIEAHLAMSCERLGLAHVPTVRSSTFGLGPGLRGQDRVIAIAQAAGARTYVNLPGGRSLYDPAAFRGADLTLAFMPAYDGPFRHMLPALLTADPATLRADLAASPQPEPA